MMAVMVAMLLALTTIIVMKTYPTKMPGQDAFSNTSTSLPQNECVVFGAGTKLFHRGQWGNEKMGKWRN
jgi:hypothetical protein